MPIGPVEYLVVGFPGNKFTGKIAPELKALVDSGTVRVLDLIFIGKDVDGSVVVFEVDELDGVAEFIEMDADVGGLIGDSDVAHAAAKNARATEYWNLVTKYSHEYWTAENDFELHRAAGVFRARRSSREHGKNESESGKEPLASRG